MSIYNQHDIDPGTQLYLELRYGTPGTSRNDIINWFDALDRSIVHATVVRLIGQNLYKSIQSTDLAFWLRIEYNCSQHRVSRALACTILEHYRGL